MVRKKLISRIYHSQDAIYFPYKIIIIFIKIRFSKIHTIFMGLCCHIYIYAFHQLSQLKLMIIPSK